MEEPIINFTPKLLTRFWSKVLFTDTCWIWTASKVGDGDYGGFYANGRTMRAHRVSYEYFYGRIPIGLEIDHVKKWGCINRACVNPEHLEAITPRENVRRSSSPPANNSRKTHCSKGHSLSGDNLIKCHLKRGLRDCKICSIENQRKRRRNWD